MTQTASSLWPAEERANYLTKCWRTGRLYEGVREWSYPARYRFYRWRKTLTDGAKPRSRYYFDPSLQEPKVLSSQIPTFFAPYHYQPCVHLEGMAGLFSEVDSQLQGIYRLAGGHCQSINDLDLNSLVDAEHHHSYHRLYWAVRYASAAALGHSQAENGLCRDLANWLAADWGQDRRIAYPYTISERIASLAEVTFWIKYGDLQQALELVVPLKRQVFLDTVHLAWNVEYWLGVHNHILNNARALHAASMMLSEIPESAFWRELAFELWDQYFPKLVLNDGSFCEETSFYLFMNCRTALEYVLAARRHNHVLPEGLNNRFSHMQQLGNDLLREDGSIPRFGNSSPDHTIGDLWGLMAAAYHHGLLLSPPRHKAITPLTVYYCGGSPQIPQSQVRDGICLYPEGGWAFLRRPELGVDLVINGDPRSRTAGHGDCGRGSFELWWHGLVLIREPGNPTYNLSTRHWYRSGQGQNVTCVNGLPPGISYEYQERMPSWYCEVQDGNWQVLGKEGVAFQCRGFRRLPRPVDWLRKWIWKGSRRLVMEEQLDGQGLVRVDSYLHLGDTPWQQISDREWQFTSPANGREGGVVRMTLSAIGKTQMMSSRFAPEYGVEKPGSMLVISGELRLPVTWSVIWDFGTASVSQ